MPLQNRLLGTWIGFEKAGDNGVLKTEKMVPFCEGHLCLYGKSPFERVPPSLYQEDKGDSKSQETFISGENSDLNLQKITIFLFALMLLVTSP